LPDSGDDPTTNFNKGITVAKSSKKAPPKANGANVGFETELFQSADKLRKNLEPSDYKHVVLGLVFLRHISETFEAKHANLMATDPAAAEDEDEYLSENIFWVPVEARWSHLQDSARQPAIGKIIDDAMTAIEKENSSLKGVLPKDYARPALDKVMLGELIDLVSGIATHDEHGKARDVLGRVYEYFLGGFAGSEGKRGGEFYTPSSVVKTLVEMIEPFPDPARGVEGRVYDPACGSGGMFVQSERFLEGHGGKVGQIAIYGQESNYTTWRLCKMNLAVRGIDSSGIAWNNEGSFLKDEHRDLRADFILANPPFNISDWGADRVAEDARWEYGTPPATNANYAWLQHIAHHLSPNGVAGVVLSNGSMSTMTNGEDTIRQAMIDGDLVDAMVALPNQLFYSTQIPACLWILSRNKKNHGFRDRSGSVLFIDARKLGSMVDRTRKELTDTDIAKIAGTYHSWRSQDDPASYADEPGFCRSVETAEIARHSYILTPGRYVGAEAGLVDDGSFPERIEALRIILAEQFAASAVLSERITRNFERLVG
jgi:type I restriction enzyme M protein